MAGALGVPLCQSIPARATYFVNFDINLSMVDTLAAVHTLRVASSEHVCDGR